MPTRQDFQAYHESIAGELRVAKDRIRRLIGNAHWQSDGEHKEAILRSALRNHLPRSLEIGRGFVCGDGAVSTQIDLLITHCDKPALYREGEMRLVTPDAVAAIVEVKTRLRPNGDPVERLANNIAMIREAGNHACCAGLFVYEPNNGDRAHEQILESVLRASQGESRRVLNWLAVGPDLFVRHWPRGSVVQSPIDDAVWHSYELTGLSHAYFISNVVWDTSSSLEPTMKYAWFPVEGTKERHRCRYIPLNGHAPQPFND